MLVTVAGSRWRVVISLPRTASTWLPTPMYTVCSATMGSVMGPAPAGKVYVKALPNGSSINTVRPFNVAVSGSSVTAGGSAIAVIRTVVVKFVPNISTSQSPAVSGTNSKSNEPVVSLCTRCTSASPSSGVRVMVYTELRCTPSACNFTVSPTSYINESTTIHGAAPTTCATSTPAITSKTAIHVKHLRTVRSVFVVISLVYLTEASTDWYSGQREPPARPFRV